MNKIFKNLCKVITSVVILSNLAFGLTLMSEDYAPYNYPDKEGKPTGISVDLVKKIIEKTKDENNIEIMPWARSYNNIQTKKNQVLFVMTKTKAREDMFKWVGPIAPNNWVLFAKEGSDINISTLEEAKNKKYSIGTYLNDAAELYLKEKGFENISSISNDKFNIKKLYKNRIDMWITGEYQGIVKVKRSKLNFKLKKIFDVKKTQLYIAFSKDVSDEIINKWQKELDILKENGEYQTILNKYLK